MNPLVILSGGKDALLARETFVTDLYIYIPLTNRVRGPYCKLRTEFFPVDLWSKHEARGP